MKHRILSLAAKELATSITFYEEQSSGLGSAFLDEYEATLCRILHCPAAWTEVSPNQRRCLFRRFPFAVLYNHDDSEIIVTSVMDLRMDPETLKTRQQRL